MSVSLPETGYEWATCSADDIGADSVRVLFCGCGRGDCLAAGQFEQVICGARAGARGVIRRLLSNNGSVLCSAIS